MTHCRSSTFIASPISSQNFSLSLSCICIKPLSTVTGFESACSLSQRVVKSFSRLSIVLIRYFFIFSISESEILSSNISNLELFIRISAAGSMSFTQSTAVDARWSNCPGKYSTATYFFAVKSMASLTVSVTILPKT